jgi:putative ABC transport system permease protein
VKKARPGGPGARERLLGFLFPGDSYLERAGDLSEARAEVEEEYGRLRARLWLWGQVFKLGGAAVRRESSWRLSMLRFYVKSALRGIWKFKSLSFINIFGLSAGLAVCFLLLLFVGDELSYDRFHQNADRIYRILENDQVFVSPQVSDIVRDSFPAVEQSARILIRDQCLLQCGENRFIEKSFAYADPGLFEIFSFRLIAGDPKTVLSRPFSIVISETAARKYFGGEDPIGKGLRMQNSLDYTVTGLMEDIPGNSHFRYDVLATLAGADQVFGKEWMSKWGWRNFVTYLLVREDFPRASFEAELSPAITGFRTLRDGEAPPVYRLQALKDIHLRSGFVDNDIQVQGNIGTVLTFSGIGILILLIACFNYVNLLTAHGAARAREVAVKKVVGCTRNQLIGQFIGESIAVLLVALGFAVGFFYLTLPAFNSLTGKQLSPAALFSGGTAAGVLGILVAAGVFSGFYPAFVLSAFQPARTLKGVKHEGKLKLGLVRVIVGGQFIISTLLIICALFMARQLRFLHSEELGYDREHVIVVTMNDSEGSHKYEPFKSALLRNSRIVSVTEASRVPSNDLNNWGGFQVPGGSERIDMPIVHVGYDYFETFGISAARGRLFSDSMETDAEQALVLNQSAVERLNLGEDPVGKPVRINWPPSDRRVVGVVEDFHFESFHRPIQPAAFVIFPAQCWQAAVKVRASGLNETLAFIEETWSGFYPDWVFEYQFVDERVRRFYESEERTFRLMGGFTFLAVFVACLGLYGLITFLTKRRLKEISIRKVLGAPAAGIFALLSGDLMRSVLLANLAAWPIAWYALNKWLRNFAYRASLSWWIFAAAGLSVSVIALLTMSWRTFRAARANPVDALKYE